MEARKPLSYFKNSSFFCFVALSFLLLSCGGGGGGGGVVPPAGHPLHLQPLV